MTAWTSAPRRHAGAVRGRRQGRLCRQPGAQLRQPRAGQATPTAG
ncbi:hypothetical protein ACRAWD_24810 [Caulobacter segnis]